MQQMNIAKQKDLPKMVKLKLGLVSDTNCKSFRGRWKGDGHTKWQIIRN